MLEPEPNQRLVELFARARELPVAERAEFLAQHCADQPQLRAELESLLEVELSPESSFLRDPVSTPRRQGVTPARSATDPRRPAPDDPPEIPGYERIELLCEGGMGAVFVAEQVHPFRRRVALKLIQRGNQSRAILSRFEVEYQALARMQHRFIAAVHDAGVSEDGQPYFAMEFVDGLPINAFCDRERLDTPQRIGLFIKVCHAVQHAHQKGILHRDLKPSNVLVGKDGDNFVPKVIDFGIAKALEAPIGDTPLFTQVGTLLGTPEYMSPEQADGRGLGLDTRSDVYSLGVILYELLTGTLPLDARRLRASSVTEMARILREETPLRPSTRVASVGEPEIVAARRGADQRGMRRLLRGDLDWITMRALEKDPNRRYVSPLALAEDLARALRHEPVEAGPPGGWYRASRLARRYRVQLVAAVLLLASLITGIVTTTHYLVLAQRSSKKEAEARHEAESAHAVAESRLKDFRLLSLVVHLDGARQREASLYPPWPERVDAMREWLAHDARRLESSLPEARRTLALLDERRTTGLAAVPGRPPSSELRSAGGDPGAREWAGATAADADRFLRDTLRTLIAQIDAFEQSEVAAVRERLVWAERVEELTIDRFAGRWEEARRAIRAADGVVASEAYRTESVDLNPQMGLVPIGMNPVSKLWEFYHLASAWDAASGIDPADLAIPAHRADGRIDADRRGIVFVLIPGGTFHMGAQAVDPDGIQFDAASTEDERPVHEVSLAPFFLARHEVTRGQWARLSRGDDPSWLANGSQADGDSASSREVRPVQRVDWTMSDRLLSSFGLALPTEAQWEYACRAGTTTPWSAGPSRTDLAGVANVIMVGPSGAELAAPGAWPVGEGTPNPFGLYDMHGNVWEWCQDLALAYDQPTRAGDGLRLSDLRVGFRIRRGGSWKYPAEPARSSSRTRNDPSFRVVATGLRAARAVLPAVR